jgi:hypothetical protein
MHSRSVNKSAQNKKPNRFLLPFKKIFGGKSRPRGTEAVGEDLHDSPLKKTRQEEDGMVHTPSKGGANRGVMPWETVGTELAKTMVTQETALKPASVKVTKIQPPTLNMLQAAVIRPFLDAHTAYTRALAVIPEKPIPLHLLIDPSIIETVPRFVRNMLGATEAVILPKIEDFQNPLREAVAKGETDTSHSETDGEDDSGPDPDSSKPSPAMLAGLWEMVVFRALRKAALGRLAAATPTVTFDEVASTVRAHVHWPRNEVLCTEALNSVLSQLAALEHRGGFKTVLRGSDGDRKEFLKLFVDLVEPVTFRDIVRSTIKERKEKTFDGICDTIVELGGLYEGIMLGRKTAASAKHNGGNGKNRQDSDAPSDKKTSQSKPNVEQKSVKGVNASVSGKGRPVPKHPPKSPCKYCGAMHWSFACPTQDDSSKRKATELPTGKSQSAKSAGVVKADGTA